MRPQRHRQPERENVISTYVLVPGAGHGGWCYQKVARLLQEAGHTVFCPTLTGVGDRSHLLSRDVDLSLHVTDIVQLLFYEDLTDVILVGHSYGGMVITGVADKAGERIGKLVYLDALKPKHGESTVDAHPPAFRTTTLLSARGAGRIVDGVELILFPSDDPRSFYGVTAEADTAWMRPRLTPHPWKCFDEPLLMDSESAVDAIRQFHIVTTGSLVVLDHEGLISEARTQGRVWELDTGHDVMITEPDALAKALIEVAAVS